MEENQEINWEQTIKPFLSENKTIELIRWQPSLENINYLDDLEKAKGDVQKLKHLVS